MYNNKKHNRVGKVHWKTKQKLKGIFDPKLFCVVFSKSSTEAQKKKVFDKI